MRRRGLEPPPGYPGLRPQPGDAGVISVRVAPDRPSRPFASTVRTHRTIRMLPRMLPRAGTPERPWRSDSRPNTRMRCGRHGRRRTGGTAARAAEFMGCSTEGLAAAFAAEAGATWEPIARPPTSASRPERRFWRRAPWTPAFHSSGSAGRAYGVRVEARSTAWTCVIGTPGPSGPIRCDHTTVGAPLTGSNAAAGIRARSGSLTISSPA